LIGFYSIQGDQGMSRKNENNGFICENCGENVYPIKKGGYRNHCPFCLFSKHVDDNPGDRLNECNGLMEPIGIHAKSGKGYQIIHRCQKCGILKVNRVADDLCQPDNENLILKLFHISAFISVFLLQ
jgi:hypothetical protein